MVVVQRGESGYVALLAVLVTGAAALVVGLALLTAGADSQRSGLASQQSKQARALAATCAQEALQQIHDNIAFLGSNTVSLGQGSCGYTVASASSTTRNVTTSGTVGTVVRKVQTTVTIGATAISAAAWQEVGAYAFAAPVSVPAFVQVQSATPQSPAASVAATYTTQTAGNMNVVVIGWNNATGTVTSVTDTAGNTYQIAAPLTRSATQSQAIYYAKNIAGGANTVTVVLSATSSFPDLRAMEYSGLDQTSPLDTSASATGGVTTASSGPLTTTFASSLIVGAGTTPGSFSAAGAGFTQRIITADSNIAEDRNVTSIGSYSATAAVNNTWVMQAVAFKAAGQ